MVHTVEIDLYGKTITLETGKMAKQANGAVVVRSGDSVVLVTACTAEEPKPGASFFPAHRRLPRIHLRRGKIPRRLHQARRPPLRKRNSHQPPDRPSDPPAVPRRLPERDPDHRAWCSRPIPSRIPTRSPSWARRPRWPSPTSRSSTCWRGVRVGMVGRQVSSPTRPITKARESKLNIVVAGTEDGIVMVEAGAQEVSEDGRARRHRVRPRVLQARSSPASAS